MNMQVQEFTSALDADRKRYKAHSYSSAELIAEAARRSGQSAFALGREAMRHSRSLRKVQMADYVRHQLWDKDMHGPDGADRFVGAEMHWPVVNTVNKLDWFQVAEDKLVMSTLVQAAGLPQPQTLATLSKGPRRHPGVTTIANADALREAVTAHPDGSLFLKTVGGMVGAGALVIEAADNDGLRATGLPEMGYGDFLDKVIGKTPYLLQVRFDNHPVLAPYLTGLATVRFTNLMRPDGAFVPCVAMKLPSNGNVTCAFWREGNLVAEVSPDSGKIIRLAQSDGPVTVAIDDHPDLPGLFGLQLPHWKEACALNASAAEVFAPIAYNSTDISLTPDGPVVVEVNYGGSLDVQQNATGRGLLTDEVHDWMLAHGLDLRGKSRRR